jgi:hypothetical protein
MTQFRSPANKRIPLTRDARSNATHVFNRKPGLRDTLLTLIGSEVPLESSMQSWIPSSSWVRLQAPF